MGNYSSNHHSFPVTMVTKEMTKAWAERYGDTSREGQSKCLAAAARSRQIQEETGSTGNLCWSHCSLMDAVVSHTGVCNGTQVLNPCCTKCHSQCSYHRCKKCNNLSCTRLSCHSFNPNALTIDFCTTFLCRTCLSPALRGSAASPASSSQCQRLSIIRGHSEELSSSQPKKWSPGTQKQVCKMNGKA